jgi:acyl carrier protein
VNDTQITDIARNALSDIAPEADLGRLAPDAALQEALDLDSMDFLDFVAALHEATGVDIPERDYPEVATLAGCVAYLARHQPTA